MRWCYSIILSLLTFSSLCAQVANNKIESRILLSPEQWRHSSTRSSEVEWNCVNRELTNTCLIYHNDQWFTINPPKAKVYYINIAGQQCRDAKGVQVVVLDGDPCRTSSYKLIKCIPFIEQADVSIRLDSLQENREYLINIDGYLGDLCDFRIQFSDYATGIPAQLTSTIKLESDLHIQGVDLTLRWTVPDSISSMIHKFHVYRKCGNEKMIFVDSLKVIRNAYGVAQKNYSLTDKPPKEGTYSYYIFGSGQLELELFSIANFNYLYNKIPRLHYRKEITFTARKPSLVHVLVFDEVNDQHLFSSTRSAVAGKNRLLLDFGEFVQKGVKKFKVIVSNNDIRHEFSIEASDQ